MDGLTWATVALAAATFLLVFWTILGDGIVRSYRQPKLHLEVEMKHPELNLFLGSVGVFKPDY